MMRYATSEAIAAASLYVRNDIERWTALAQVAHVGGLLPIMFRVSLLADMLEVELEATATVLDVDTSQLRIRNYGHLNRPFFGHGTRTDVSNTHARVDRIPLRHTIQLPLAATDDQRVDAFLYAALDLYAHECKEQFRLNGVRVRDPHKTHTLQGLV